MAYASQQDMVDRYGEPKMIQLTDRADPPAGAIDATLLARRLDDASALIDGYLVGRYVLPLPVIPAVLKVHACSLCMYSLLGDTVEKDSAAAEDKRAAITYLTQVAKGDIALVPPAIASEPAGVGAVLFNAGQKVMGRDDANTSGGGDDAGL